MGRVSSIVRVSAAACSCLAISLVLRVAVAEQESPSRSCHSPSNIELKLRTGPDSESFFRDHGDSASSMECLVRDQGRSRNSVRHRFPHRVVRLTEEHLEWPELKFGWRTVTALVLGGIGAAMSSAGGTGGGGLFVPLFNLLLQFDAKTSAALSNFMILGGSLASLYINLRRRHPTVPRKPLIDFDVVMLLQPNLLLGISTGVILNVVLPDWVITALLILTLGYMTVNSLKLALRQWRKETQQNRLRFSHAAPNSHALQALPNKGCSSIGGDMISSREPGAQNSIAVTVDRKEEETSFSGSEVQDTSSKSLLPVEQPFSTRSVLPSDKLAAFSITWVAFFAIQVFRGGKSSQSLLGVPACGWAYWLLTLTQVPLAVGLTAWTILRLHVAHRESTETPESTQENEFVLKPESCTPLASMAFIAGTLGGLLGTGGGMVINPMLLARRMLPQVTQGTVAAMVFFSSSMSVVQFWLLGRVPVAYALVVALLCFLVSFVGVTLVQRAIDRYNRASLIVFSVAVVMGVSAVLISGFGGFSAWQKFESGASLGFHYPC